MKKILRCAAVCMFAAMIACGCKKDSQTGQSQGAAAPAAPLPTMSLISISPDGGVLLEGKPVAVDAIEAEMVKLVKASPGGVKVEISFVKADVNTFAQLEPVIQACVKAKVIRATVGKYPYGLAADAKQPAPVAAGVLPIRIGKKEDLDSIAQTAKAQLSGKLVGIKCSPATKIPLIVSVLKMLMASEANFVFQHSDPAIGDGVEIQAAQLEEAKK